MEKIRYSWFNEEHTVLLCSYNSTDWTWDDFHEAFKTQAEMIDSVDSPEVHVIVDTTSSNWLPKGGSLLSGVHKLTNLKHPRQGHTIIVGAHGIIAAVAKIVTKMMGENRQEVHLINSMDEAEQLVSKLLQSQV